MSPAARICAFAALLLAIFALAAVAGATLDPSGGSGDGHSKQTHSATR